MSTLTLMLRIALSVFILCAASAAQDLKGIEKDLDYLKGKLLVLRRGFTDSSLTFDHNGNIKGKATPAAVTLNGILKVTSVKVSATRIQLKGERIALFLNTKNHKVQGLNTGEEFKVAIESAQAINSLRDANILLDPVFHEGTYIGTLLSSYWKELIPMGDESDRAKKEGRPIGMLLRERPVYLVSPDVVSAPAPTHMPDPVYAEEARRKRVTGTSIWSLYVNENGQPELIEVNTELERDLDLTTVDALRKWRFKPAVKNGMPVTVKISVEMNFHLY